MKSNMTKFLLLFFLSSVSNQSFSATIYEQLKQNLLPHHLINNSAYNEHKKLLGIGVSAAKCKLVNFTGNVPDTKPITYMTFFIYGSAFLKKPDTVTDYVVMSNTIHFFHDDLDEVIGTYYLEVNADKAYFIDKVVKNSGSYISRYKCPEEALTAIKS